MNLPARNRITEIAGQASNYKQVTLKDLQDLATGGQMQKHNIMGETYALVKFEGKECWQWYKPNELGYYRLIRDDAVILALDSMI